MIKKKKATKFIASRETLLFWLNSLNKNYDIFAPVLEKKGETVFKKIDDSTSINLDYPTSMTSPRKFIYLPRCDLFKINRDKNKVEIMESKLNKKIIFGVHPCDMQAISILDKTFLGDYKDYYYAKLREETITMVLNCNDACQKKYPNFTLKGFCSSMGSGPFLKLKKGYDVEVTMLDKKLCLLEAGSDKGKVLLDNAKGLKSVTKKELEQKIKLEKKAIKSFTKKLETKNLPQLLAKNLQHPIYKDTAENRCLGCTNCTMVCPTCFCYNIEDETCIDLKTSTRKRHWDSCLEVNFSKVHDGNFRESREARLRQFVTHKLSNWVEQYGCLGCVGCGRCMTWCPTNIDLTDIAKEIQQDAKRGKTK